MTKPQGIISAINSLVNLSAPSRNFVGSVLPKRLVSEIGAENIVRTNDFLVRPLGKITATYNLQFCVGGVLKDENQYSLFHLNMIDNPHGKSAMHTMLGNFSNQHLDELNLYLYQFANPKNDGDVAKDNTLWGMSQHNLALVVTEFAHLGVKISEPDYGSHRAFSTDGISCTPYNSKFFANYALENLLRAGKDKESAQR